MKKIIDSIRREYTGGGIDIHQLPDDPVILLEAWLRHALDKGLTDPNAMILSTVSKNKPSSRTVLLKGVNRKGLVFYTNYHSRKGREMEENPHVCAVFFWSALERQVRVEGTVRKVSKQESDEYFSTRPRMSQIGAWSSPQSEIVEDRETMEKEFQKYERKFKDKPVPRPGHWGGYRISPESFEFWQGRSGRLNDRILYSLKKKTWKKVRLAP